MSCSWASHFVRYTICTAECVLPADVSALHTLTAFVCMRRIGIVAGIIAWQVIIKSVLLILVLLFVILGLIMSLIMYSQVVVTSNVEHGQVTK
jgi:hypothetical protein